MLQRIFAYFAEFIACAPPRISLEMTCVIRKQFRLLFLATSLGAVALPGCSTTPAFAPKPPSDAQVATDKDKFRSLSQISAAASDTSAPDNEDTLDKLWQNRTNSISQQQSRNFLLGPGDVLRISLPQIDGQRDRTVRVTEENTIALPLLGVINVSDMTVANLRDELIRREQNYVYVAQVGVFLEHSENSNVAVLGSVKAPGRYMVASRDDTILTMIGRAGGLTDDAASQIILVPAPLNPESSGPRLLTKAKLTSQGSPQDDVLPKQQEISDQIVIEMRNKNTHDLQLPARSGDVIIVPSAGDVTVEGWVSNPGKFKITQGMTALSAIAAAGGAQFSRSATLVREQKLGGKLDIPLNLTEVEHGDEPDVPVQGGDVVIVDRSLLGAVPYSLYFVVSHVGLGVPLF